MLIPTSERVSNLCKVRFSHEEAEEEMNEVVITCYNMKEPQRYYAKSKKQVTKDHLLWFHSYKMSQTGKSIETKKKKKK